MRGRSGPGIPMRAIGSPEEAGQLVTVLVTEDRRSLPLSSDVHAGFELAILTAGRQERYTPDHRMTMIPGDVFLSPAWEPHGWRDLARYTKVVNVHFRPEFLGNEAFEGESWLSMFACAPQGRPRVVGDEMRAKVLAIAHELSDGYPAFEEHDEWAVDGPAGAEEVLVATRRRICRGNAGLPLAWEEEARLNVLRLLLILYRGWANRRRAGLRQVADPGHLARIMPAIERAIPRRDRARRVNLREAARASNLSLTTFRRVFRRTMGLTFGRFELQQRTAMAERLLLRTNLPVAAIAERCDFTDISHFHRTFRKLYGETPGRYRTLARKTAS